MQSEPASTKTAPPAPGAVTEASHAETHSIKRSNWLVLGFQLLFLSVMLLNLDGPFVSAHNERQNETFDMARHVFRDGWRSVLTPKVSYCIYGFEKEPETAVLQEFPFHGLFGWPLALLTGHERAAVRIVSTVFALLSIQLIYWMLRFWLPPLVSAIGAGVWASAPLVLHFGQVPMPDILCTTGILGAFWFALRGRLPASSACFAFAIQAKVSVIVFGLPVLTALLVSRNCGTVRKFIRLSLLWGWLPLLSLVFWETALYTFAPPETPMSVFQIWRDGKTWALMAQPGFYKFLLGCLLPFGIGVLGLASLFFAKRATGARMNARVKWSIVISNLVFVCFMVRKVPEPQYALPLLPWFVLAASFGLDFILEKCRAGLFWRIAFGFILALHVLVAAFFTIDLKLSRVPNLPAIERAGQLLPPDARVVVLYRFYGAGPAVWLNRNVVPFTVPVGLDEAFARFRKEGFNYALILDIESLHNPQSTGSFQGLASRILQIFSKSSSAASATVPVYTDPAGPYRQFCDHNFTQIFAQPHVVLYSMKPYHEKN